MPTEAALILSWLSCPPNTGSSHDGGGGWRRDQQRTSYRVHRVRQASSLRLDQVAVIAEGDGGILQSWGRLMFAFDRLRLKADSQDTAPYQTQESSAPTSLSGEGEANPSVLNGPEACFLTASRRRSRAIVRECRTVTTDLRIRPLTIAQSPSLLGNQASELAS